MSRSKNKVWVRAKVMPDGAPMTIYGREAWCLRRLLKSLVTIIADSETERAAA